jgi:hypothetical protein
MTGMVLLVIGAGVLAAVLGLFYVKDRVRRPALARLAYSELMMRVTVVAVALMALGLMLMLSEMFP